MRRVMTTGQTKKCVRCWGCEQSWEECHAVDKWTSVVAESLVEDSISICYRCNHICNMCNNKIKDNVMMLPTPSNDACVINHCQ